MRRKTLDLLLRKIRRIFYLFIGSKRGLGLPQTKELWETQYSGNTWDILYDKNEQEHYQALSNLYSNSTKQNSVLDIGCGEGVLYAFLNKAGCDNYQGIDLSETAIRKARMKYQEVNFVAASGENFKPKTSFDCIIFNESLYYFSNPIKTLRYYEQYLATDGIFIISMCEYLGHSAIWEKINRNYSNKQKCQVKNTKGQIWNISAYSLNEQLN